MARKVIQVSFSEREYAFLEKQAADEGTTIALHIKNKVLEDTAYKKWFEELVTRVSGLKEGTAFTVKMVLATDWPNIERGVRLALGRGFYKYVKAGKLKSVYETQKDSANVQWYRVGGEN